MIYLNKDSFAEETAEGLVLIDFYADWCGPCKMLAPVLEQASRQLEGKVKICKINVDEEMDLAREFNVVSIPNLVLMKDGKVVDSKMGYMPINQLIEFIESGY